jgi:hypothetical protein
MSSKTGRKADPMSRAPRGRFQFTVQKKRRRWGKHSTLLFELVTRIIGVKLDLVQSKIDWSGDESDWNIIAT